MDNIENKIAEAINEFGIKLLKNINESHYCNVAISPLSLTSSLAMLFFGSKDETNLEIKQILGFLKYNINDKEALIWFKNMFDELRISNTQNFILSIAIRLIVQNEYQILESYRKLIQKHFNASIEEEDFVKNSKDAIQNINSWVAVKTFNKIKSIYDEPFSKDTKLVLVNAVYFKGKWAKKFLPEYTYEDTFTNIENTKSNVQMMSIGYDEFKFCLNMEIEADFIELPYYGDYISMFIILPHKINGLKKTLTAITEQIIISSIKSMKLSLLKLILPKFKLEKSFSIVENLKCLGLSTIFTEKADLSLINGQKTLKMSDVVHKVFIEVNEEGTEASAATGITIADSVSRPPSIIHFKVDHPFILMIRDNINNQNLFFCQVTHL